MRILSVFLILSGVACSGWGAAPNASEFWQRWSNHAAEASPLHREPELHYRSPVTQRTNAFSLTPFGKAPEAMSVVVTTRDVAPLTHHPPWAPFQTNLTVDFGPGEGQRYLWLGYRHTEANGYSEGWKSYSILVQLSPPIVGITSPPERILPRPMIQLQGFCSTDVGQPIPYEVRNQQGVVTSRGEGLVHSSFDGSPSSFRCYDVELSPGTNSILLHVTDLAGYSVTTNVVFVFTTAGKTNAPTFKPVFPHDNALISGSEFTIEGPCDDPTAKITALVCDDRGKVARHHGLLERNGYAWVEHIPLTEGISQITVVAADVAGNSSLTNLTVGKSKYTFHIDPIGDPQRLWQRTITISGYYSRTNASVSINGVRAKMNPDGHWVAEKVPVESHNGGGTASFLAKLEPNDEPLAPSHSWQPAFFGAPSHSLQAALSFPSVETNQYNHYPIVLGLTNLSGTDQPHRWMLPDAEHRFVLRLSDSAGQPVSRLGSLQKHGAPLPTHLNIHHLGEAELDCLDGILPVQSNAVVQTVAFNLDQYSPRLPPGDYRLELEERLFEIADGGRLLPVSLPSVKANLTVLEQPSEMVFELEEWARAGKLSWGAALNGLRLGIAHDVVPRKHGGGLEVLVFVENLSTNDLRNLRLPRLEEQYEITLFDPTGAEVPKTALGKERGKPVAVQSPVSGPLDEITGIARSLLGIGSPRRRLNLRPLWLSGRDATELGSVTLNDLFEIKGRGTYRLRYQQRLVQLGGTNGPSGLTLPKVIVPLELP